MAGFSYKSNRDQYRQGFAEEMGKRVDAADEYFASQVRADVSQPGTLRYRGKNKKTGKFEKTTTVYNFTHSRPGNPPYKQSGQLRASIATERVGLIGRVGSNIRRPKYPLFLELGTRKMASRSYLRTNLIKHKVSIRRILTKRIPAGGLPPVKSFQFRSGHFGRGAAAAGWA